MLTLYHWEPNTCFLKPLIALNEKQLPFTSRWFDASRPEADASVPVSTEVRLRQEREGPVLVHDGAVICGSFFMLEYLAEGLPGPPLHGADAFEQYRVQAWGQQLVALGAEVSFLGSVQHLAPALRRQEPAALEAQLSRIEPIERQQAWRAVLEATPEALAASRERLALQLARVEHALRDSPWLAGGRCTIADIDAYALSFPLPALVPDLVNDRATPHLAGFLQRMQARPAVQAALATSRTGRPQEAFVPGAEPSRWG